ncbi:hypothetical protein MPSEU_000292600 [Mayamaea pseudoterrestris]|nr:hypothetical protein MPSEU_000292600 [Mayamaea pseudoterrestris]
MAFTTEQAAVNAALEAALNDLDSDNESSDDDAKPEAAVSCIPSHHGAAATATEQIGDGSTSNLPSDNVCGIASSQERVVFGPPRPPPEIPDDFPSDEKLLCDLMKQLLPSDGLNGDIDADDVDPDQILNRVLQEMQSQLESFETNEPVAPTQASKGQEAKAAPSNDLDAAIENLAQGVASQVTMLDIQAPPKTKAPNLNDPTSSSLPGLLKGLTGNWSDDNADALMDGMMEQLLSKELMYEPMKQVADQFPQWLQDNQMYISQQEYDDRRKQAECFRRLVHAYETQPTNTKLYMELMQEAQEFGQPPSDLLKEIAPDLELDDNGMPKLDGMAFPTDEECRIM